MVDFMASISGTLGPVSMRLCHNLVSPLYLLQAVLRTVSERTTVRELLDSTACKSTNLALLRFLHMYKFANHDRNAAVQLVTVA